MRARNPRTQRLRLAVAAAAAAATGISRLTQADEDPLESLVRAGLQIKQGELVISAVLHLVADCLEQHRRPVQLERRTKKTKQTGAACHSLCLEYIQEHVVEMEEMCFFPPLVFTLKMLASIHSSFSLSSNHLGALYI